MITEEYLDMIKTTTIKNRLYTLAKYIQMRENKIVDFKNDKTWIKYKKEQDVLYNTLKRISERNAKR